MLAAYRAYPGSLLAISCQDIEKTSEEILQPLSIISPKYGGDSLGSRRIRMASRISALNHYRPQIEYGETADWDEVA